MKNYFLQLFKRKSNFEIVELKAEAMANDLFTSDFSTKEIALICDLFSADVINRLERSRSELVDNLHDVVQAINHIKK